MKNNFKNAFGWVLGLFAGVCFIEIATKAGKKGLEKLSHYKLVKKEDKES